MLRKFFATFVVFSLLNISCTFAMGEGDEQFRTPVALQQPSRKVDNDCDIIKYCNAPLPIMSSVGAFLTMRNEPMEWWSMLSVAGLFSVTLLSSLKLYYDCNKR